MSAVKVLPLQNGMEPETKEQKQMLEAQRDGLRREGFSAHIQYETALAQDLGGDDEAVNIQTENGLVAIKRKEYLAQLQKKSQNAYAAARRMQELIDAIGEAE